MPPPLKAAGGFGVSYREFSDEDLPFVAELYASTRREEVAATGWPLEMQEAFLAQQHDAQHRHYALHFADAEWLIVERGEEAIGRLYLRDLGENLHIVDISLLPHSRQKGIGGAIMQDILDHARSLGKGLSIHVEKYNPARSLYARLGFEMVEDRGVYDLLRAPS
ncbi:MAG TPA: GNAT family N-acetyltransferase [Croceibacterium sp.]